MLPKEEMYRLQRIGSYTEPCETVSRDGLIIPRGEALIRDKTYLSSLVVCLVVTMELTSLIP